MLKPLMQITISLILTVSIPASSVCMLTNMDNKLIVLKDFLHENPQEKGEKETHKEDIVILKHQKVVVYSNY